MQATDPHYLLFTAATRQPSQPGRWQFVLAPVGGGRRLVANDTELDTDQNRLELLAAVRGFEALDQPSVVTLVTGSRYVRRGIGHDLVHWRDAGWRWERFGKRVPIRDLDLWLRVDRALSFHQLDRVAWAWNLMAGEQPAASRRPRLATRRWPAKRQRRLAHWGQDVLTAVPELGRGALSQTA